MNYEQVAIRSQFEGQGYSILPPILNSATVESLLNAIQGLISPASTSTTESLYALRNLFDLLPEIATLACSPNLRAIAESCLGRDCFAVRAIYFDKLPESNWKVPWHQDLSVALQSRIEVEGFSAWSHKAGVVHAQAPTWLLEKMVTLRIHLDACGVENAPLRVLPGSHRYGKLSSEQIHSLRQEQQEVVCEVERGGILVMRPLLLHASSPAIAPSHRRVIHLEFANAALPSGLEWNTRLR